MKNLVLTVALILSSTLYLIAQNVAPYIKIGTSTESIQQNVDKVTQALQDNGFSILGSYNPENNPNLKVIAFTNNNLKNTVIKVADRGALGAVLKVGFVLKTGIVTMSYTNPDYILRAYLGDSYEKYKPAFQKISSDLKTTFTTIGNEFTPFGGSEKASNLKKYHYKIMMPYFTDPVELKEYASFEEGLKTIQNNLKAKKGSTSKVFELIYPAEKVAVFGIALESTKDGEATFLPKIGEDNIAAMPYEIILQGNKATMLHGKYRLAISWPELTMGTFMKIMSTPGDIEDTLKAVCE